jgi:Xaa-Pro aminopeptidase
MDTTSHTMIGESWEIPVFTREEGLERWKRIRTLMKEQQLDCLLIGGSTYNYRSGYGDIRYVSNSIPNSDDAYMIFPYEGDPVLYVWSILSQYHCEKTSWIEVDHCQATQNGHTFPQVLAQKIKDRGLDKGRLGVVDQYSWFLYAYERLTPLLPQAAFVDAGEILRTVRRLKSPAELEYVRKSAQLADIGWEALKNAVKPGATKFELIAEMEYAMVCQGAEVGGMNLLDVKQWPDGWGFPLGGSYRKLKDGDIINCEITPSYGGYYAQLVRPISLGTPTDDFYALFDLHKEIYNRSVALMEPGNIAQVVEDSIGRWAMDQHKDLSFASSGFQMLDNMFRPPLYMGEFQPTMVFMVHAITFPSEADIATRTGHGGHIIGDTYIIREGKPEALTKLPLEVAIV